MRTFETTLTGSDTTIDGVVTRLPDSPYPETYRFDSVDDTLHLIIAKAIDGSWIRLEGTEPHMFGWVDELADKITTLQQKK